MCNCYNKVYINNIICMCKRQYTKHKNADIDFISGVILLRYAILASSISVGHKRMTHTLAFRVASIDD